MFSVISVLIFSDEFIHYYMPQHTLLFDDMLPELNHMLIFPVLQLDNYSLTLANFNLLHSSNN